MPITPPDFGIGIPDIDIGRIDIPNIATECFPPSTITGAAGNYILF